MIIITATKLNVTDLVPAFVKEVLRQIDGDNDTKHVQMVQINTPVSLTGYWKIFDALKGKGFTPETLSSMGKIYPSLHKNAFIINDDTIPVRSIFYDLMGKGINPERIRFYRVYNKDEDKEIVQ